VLDGTSPILFGYHEESPFWAYRGGECPGDIDGNGIVEIRDIVILLSQWGCPFEPCSADIDGDGDVALSDLALLLSNFSEYCP
jgi:hypothetical protein